MHLSFLFYRLPNKINESFFYYKISKKLDSAAITEYNKLGMSNDSLKIYVPEFSSLNARPITTILSPYMLKKANTASISRAAIVKKQIDWYETLSPSITHYYLRIKAYEEAKPYDFIGLSYSKTAYPERLTFVVYYQIFFNIYYTHYKAIYLLTNF